MYSLSRLRPNTRSEPPFPLLPLLDALGLVDGALEGLRADGPAAAGRRRRRAEVDRPVAVPHRTELGWVH